DKRLSRTMELMSEGGMKERIVVVGKKLKRLHHFEDALLKDLEELANYLDMVEQSYKYMIQSLMFPLIKPRIFWHEDVRVKIMVVTFIAEVTRVTAPNLSYSDDIMRDIFEHMVGSSYPKFTLKARGRKNHEKWLSPSPRSIWDKWDQKARFGRNEHRRPESNWDIRAKRMRGTRKSELAEKGEKIG
ncbi:hypothetical protein KI387_042675, partial [Taxus chinensis]